MPTKRQDLRTLITFAMLLASRLAFADCPPGQTPASCALHDEGVAAFTAGKYDEAATKFRAAISAGATARSYLGYSQAVEGQGKIALAYETMLVAQKLSNDELATPNGKSDAGIVGRAERIKYKLAELGAKIAYVWLRLPQGVSIRRLVSVFREGEGDLQQPIGRWIVVAPEKQILFATLDDGKRVQITAQVAAGSQGTLIIPVPAAQPVQQQPVQQQPVQQPVTLQPQPYPLAPAPGDVPEPKRAKNPPNTLVAIDAAFIMRNDDNVGVGIGFAGLFEKKLAKPLAVTGRAAYVFHPSKSTESGLTEVVATSANEGLLLAGIRTRSKLPLYASLEVGAMFYERVDTFTTATVDREESYRHTYPTTMLGGGVRIGKVHFEAYMLAVANTGDIDLPTRFFATFGVDLYRN